MTLTLTSDMFNNGVYSISYGLKKAVFTIVDEDYGVAKINRMVCDIQAYDASGNLVSEEFGSLVIGLGDSNIAVTSSETALLGKVMTESNMATCVS